MKQRRQ